MKLTSLLKKGAIAIASLTVLGVVSASKASYSQPAPGQSGFYCDTSESIPTTVYQNTQGGREPWIKWSSSIFPPPYTPLTRCKQVSDRLETYWRNRELKLITVGKMNGQNVICTASRVNGRWEKLIYTLKPGQDPIRTLNNFLAWREGQAGTPSLFESTVRQRPYIDVSDRLEYDTEVETPTRSETIVQPERKPNIPAGREELF